MELLQAFRQVMEARNANKRFFEAVICENGYTSIEYFYTPCQIDLNGSEYEYIYSIYENYLEAVNSLPIGQSMYFQPTRDDNTSKGIITRIF